METKKQTTVKQQSTFDLIITDKVERKIRYLCDMFKSTEWSGVLFYTAEGSFEDGSFKATCVDLHPMDIGDATFTKFSDSPEIINYELNNNLLDGVYEGLIHSHHNMSAYFSSTDADTLYKEGKEINHFLSLIVNNDGNYVARITRKVLKKRVGVQDLNYTEEVVYNTFEDAEVVISPRISKSESQPFTDTDTEIQHYNLNIIKPANVYEFETISKRLGEIKKEKTKTRPYSYGSDYDADSWLHRSFTNPNRVANTPKQSYPSYNQAYNQAYHEYSYRTPGFSETPKQNKLYGDGPSELWSSSINEIPDTCNIEGIEIKLDMAIIENLCNQLLTSNLLFPMYEKLTKKAVEELDDMYAKRFFITEIKFERETFTPDFIAWIQVLMETIIFEERPEIEDQFYNYVGNQPTYEDTYPFVATKMIEYMEYMQYDKISHIAKYIISELKTYI